MRLATAFDRWIFDSFRVTPQGLALYRIAYALFVLLVVSPGHGPRTRFGALGTFPDAFFLPPPGPMRLLGGFPPPWFFEALTLALTVSAAALLVGYRTRWASVGIGVLFLVANGFLYSFGKINHTMLFDLVPLVMTFSGWGAAYSVDRLQGRSAGRRVAAWPLTLLALVVGFGMFTAGFPKLIGGWLDPSTHATYGHLIKQMAVRGRAELLAPFFASLESALFWEALDYATVAFEVGFLFAIFHPRTTRLFAALAVLFHLGILLMLNLAFAINMITYAAFLDWERLRRALHVPRRLPAAHVPTWAAPAGVLALGTLFYLFGSPLLLLNAAFPFASDLTALEVVVTVGAALVVVALAARRTLAFLRSAGGRRHVLPSPVGREGHREQ